MYYFVYEYSIHNSIDRIYIRYTLNKVGLSLLTAILCNNLSMTIVFIIAEIGYRYTLNRVGLSLLTVILCTTLSLTALLRLCRTLTGVS